MAPQANEHGHRAIAELLASHAGKQVKVVNSVLSTALRRTSIEVSEDKEDIATDLGVTAAGAE